MFGDVLGTLLCFAVAPQPSPAVLPVLEYSVQNNAESFLPASSLLVQLKETLAGSALDTLALWCCTSDMQKDSIPQTT